MVTVSHFLVPRFLHLRKDDEGHEENEWNKGDGIQEHCQQGDRSKDHPQRGELLHQWQHELKSLRQRQEVGKSAGESGTQTSSWSSFQSPWGDRWSHALALDDT